jgi:quercetin dioxygenase-like cupin family protein
LVTQTDDDPVTLGNGVEKDSDTASHHQTRWGRTLRVVGGVYRFLATGANTNGQHAMGEAIVPPGGGPPPHVYSREEEGFYILEGEITFQAGDEQIVTTAGMFVNMPIGMPRSLKNESGNPILHPVPVAASRLLDGAGTANHVLRGFGLSFPGARDWRCIRHPGQ